MCPRKLWERIKYRLIYWSYRIRGKTPPPVVYVNGKPVRCDSTGWVELDSQTITFQHAPPADHITVEYTSE